MSSEKALPDGAAGRSAGLSKGVKRGVTKPGKSVAAKSPVVGARLAIKHPHAAGIDVHSDRHYVSVGPGQVEVFGAYTCDLHALSEYLRQHHVTAVAMESTGVYWLPLHAHLCAQGFAVEVIEPGQLKHCGARPKSDVVDCQWIQRLHTYGLLRGSFIPAQNVVALRTYQRLRERTLRQAAQHVLHMQKALEQMNLKLTEVLSDITGVSGMLMIDAILRGERAPDHLAELASPRCKASREEIAKALTGQWHEEHLFELQQALSGYRFALAQVLEIDSKLEAELVKLPHRDLPPPASPPKKSMAAKIA